MERGSTELSEVVLPERVDDLKKISAWHDCRNKQKHTNTRTEQLLETTVFNTYSLVENVTASGHSMNNEMAKFPC